MSALKKAIPRYPVKRSARSMGQIVAAVLAGSWRSSPPRSEISAEELADISTLLLKSGSAGLAWCKVRHLDLEGFEELQQAYRLQYLHAALHERKLKEVIPALRDEGVEPVLVKGWAIAGHYSEPGMRPYCDLDLCVLPDQYETALSVIKSPKVTCGNIDLHLGFGKFYDHRSQDIFARSRIVMLDELEVRVLSPEDDLRFLCVHVLRHGVVRPLWLCDIAVLLESLPAEFDWDRCLSGSSRQADWIACALALAVELLGVDVQDMPIPRRAGGLPKWMTKAVLRAWGTPYETPRQIRDLVRKPLAFLRELPLEISRHWPNPIEATMTLSGPFNRLPRWTFQIGHVVSRTSALVPQLLEDLGGAIHHRG